MYSKMEPFNRLLLSALVRVIGSGTPTGGSGNGTIVTNGPSFVTKKLRLSTDLAYYTNHCLNLNLPPFCGGCVIIYELSQLPSVCMQLLDSGTPIWYAYPYVDDTTKFAEDLGGIDIVKFSSSQTQVSLPPVVLPIPSVAGPIRIAIQGWGNPGAKGAAFEIYTPRRFNFAWRESQVPAANKIINSRYQLNLSDAEMMNDITPTPLVTPEPLSEISGCMYFGGSAFYSSSAIISSDPSVANPRRELDPSNTSMELRHGVILTPMDSGIAHYTPVIPD